jgi:hypothetical protein
MPGRCICESILVYELSGKLKGESLVPECHLLVSKTVFRKYFAM